MLLENYCKTRIAIACSFPIAVRTIVKPQTLLQSVKHKTGEKKMY